jgi:hypothetical protein
MDTRTKNCNVAITLACKSRELVHDRVVVIRRGGDERHAEVLVDGHAQGRGGAEIFHHNLRFDQSHVLNHYTYIE